MSQELRTKIQKNVTFLPNYGTYKLSLNHQLN